MSARVAGRMLAIVNDLLHITRQMSKSTDPDFLVEAIDRRGELMEEYDKLKESHPEAAAALLEESKPQISEMISEIIELDKKINEVLYSLYHESKIQLKSSNQNSKILHYTNNAISATGSYIDLKE